MSAASRSLSGNIALVENPEGKVLGKIEGMNQSDQMTFFSNNRFMAIRLFIYTTQRKEYEMFQTRTVDTLIKAKEMSQRLGIDLKEKVYFYDISGDIPMPDVVLIYKQFFLDYLDHFEIGRPISDEAMKNDLEATPVVCKKCLKCNGIFKPEGLYQCPDCKLALYCSAECLVENKEVHRPDCEFEAQLLKLMPNAGFGVYLDHKDPMAYFSRNRRLSMQLCAWTVQSLDHERMARSELTFNKTRELYRGHYMNNDATHLLRDTNVHWNYNVETDPPIASNLYYSNEMLASGVEEFQLATFGYDHVQIKAENPKTRKCFYCYDSLAILDAVLACNICKLALYCSSECLRNDSFRHKRKCAKEMEFWKNTKNMTVSLCDRRPDLRQAWNISDEIQPDYIRFVPRLFASSRHRWLATKLYVLYRKALVETGGAPPLTRNKPINSLARAITGISEKAFLFGYLFTEGNHVPGTRVPAPVPALTYIPEKQLLVHIRALLPDPDVDPNKKVDLSKVLETILESTCMSSKYRQPRKCDYCALKVEKGKAKGCEDCRLAIYCSEECLVKDYPIHKEECDIEVERWKDGGDRNFAD